MGDCKIEKGEGVTKEGSGTVKKNMWRKKYATLVEFHRENGTCDVPADHKLAKWVQLQKRRFVKMQKNCPKRVKLLNEIGFDSGKQSSTTTMTQSEKKKHHNDLFKKKLALLHAFKDEHGHCDVPANQPELGRWVKSLRARHASGALQKNHPEKVEKLNELGIEWKSKDETTPVDGTVAKSYFKQGRQERFPKKLALLRDFKDEYGNCNVPPDHPELGHWVTSLRTRYASGLLQKKHPNVVDKLTALGFVWNHQKHVVTATLVPDTTLGKNSVRKNRGNGWDKKVRMLKEYKKKTGNSIPPKDHKLGPWVRLVNRKYRMIQKHYPELSEDLGDGTSSPSSSSASGGDGVSKNKKSLPFAKVN